MSKEQEITNRANKISNLLIESRLKEALNLLGEQINEISDWSVSSRFEEINIAYSYMLQYFGQGIKDDKRESLYRSLIGKTYLLSDDALRVYLVNNSQSVFYRQLRKETNGDIARYRMILESNTEEPNIIIHEQTVTNLFSYIWTSGLWQSTDVEEVSLFLESPLINEQDAALITSAITMSLLQRFDPKKVMVLGIASRNISYDVSIRALTGLLISGMKYDSIIPYFPEISGQLNILSEVPEIIERIRTIQIALLMCRETQKIDRKMREEIIPTMLHNPKLGNMMIEDMESDDQNPDWEQWINNNNFKDKIIEMTELQMEGADVYMSTFCNLKGYPFFKEVSNWLRPFCYEQPDVANSIGNIKIADSPIIKTIFNSEVFCNSDKYSFCLTFSQIPKEQRDMIFAQLESQTDSENEENNNIYSKSKSIETLSKQYVQDLYRFFKLFPNRTEFYDPFGRDLNMLNCKSLSPLLNNIINKRTIAEFLLRKEYFAEAAEIFNSIEKDEKSKDIDYQFYQKMGYAFQRSQKYSNALECYCRADIMQPDNLWTMRHCAQCYRILGNPQKALETLNHAELFDSDNLSLQIQIGECLVDLKQYKEALSRFFKVEFLKPNMVKAWRAIAWCAFLSDKMEQATKYYERLISQSKPQAQDYLNSGHVAWTKGEIKKAVSMYKECINLEGPDHFKEELDADFNILQEKGIEKSDYPLMLDMLN
jgi:tetratricopeptide (TPR) repeat protein